MQEYIYDPVTGSFRRYRIVSRYQGESVESLAEVVDDFGTSKIISANTIRDSRERQQYKLMKDHRKLRGL